MLNRIVTVVIALLTAGPLMAADDGAAQLLAVEDARFKAELAHDAAAFDRVVANDVVYSHMNGRRETKADLMARVERIPFSSIVPSERQARVLGDFGTVRGKIVRQLPDRVLTDGYLAVYVLRDGRWQLLEWASAAPETTEHAK